MKYTPCYFGNDLFETYVWKYTYTFRKNYNRKDTQMFSET